MAKKGLGKGLGAIFGEDVVKESKEELEKAKAKRAAAAEEIDEKGRILMLKLDLIQPNKEQPRKTFDEEQINELAGSIKQYGVLQPLLVQKSGSFYEIIARGAQMARCKSSWIKRSSCSIKRIQQTGSNGDLSDRKCIRGQT